MRSSRGVVLLSVVSLAAVLLAGCASGEATQRTVYVTETGSVASGSESVTGTSGVTVGPLPSGSETAESSASSDTSASESSAESPTSASVPPFAAVDALAVDCAKIMNGTKLSEVFGGGIPGGTNRIVDAENAERGITGRVRCQYGVAADQSIIAVTIIFTQFTDAAAATAQLELTVETEKGLGATASTTTVNGYPAEILIRDGGLLVMNYGDWNMSVVIADNVMDESKLPAALTATAEYALGKVTGV